MLNSEAVVLASVARTATTTSDAQVNNHGAGVALLIDVTDVQDFANISAVAVQARVGAGWKTIYSFTGLTIAAATQYAFLVYPGATSGGGWTSAPLAGAIPRHIRYVLTHDNSDPITYELRASYIG